jgi:general secretion pathway protein D
MKITPRINAANFVTLEIDQVIEEIESIDPQVGPTTSKRSIKSTVVVKDQNTVVIGGLQKSRQISNKSAIPWLGEIPVIGYFFRNTTSERERRNLLLLLTPHVIEGPDDFRAIFKRKLEEHREFVARFQKDGSELKLGLDYGKKHGLLEAINQSIRAAEEERALLDELKRQEQRPPLPQELDGIDVPVPPEMQQPSEAAQMGSKDGKPRFELSVTRKAQPSEAPTPPSAEFDPIDLSDPPEDESPILRGASDLEPVPDVVEEEIPEDKPAADEDKPASDEDKPSEAKTAQEQPSAKPASLQDPFGVSDGESAEQAEE